MCGGVGGGGPAIPAIPAAMQRQLQEGMRQLQGLGLSPEGGGPPGTMPRPKPGAFPAGPPMGFPGPPSCHPPTLPAGMRVPGGPGGPSAARPVFGGNLPPDVSPIPAPPGAMKPIPTPAGAPPMNPDGSKVLWYSHVGSATPVGVNEATANFFMLRRL